DRRISRSAHRRRFRSAGVRGARDRNAARRRQGRECLHPRAQALTRYGNHQAEGCSQAQCQEGGRCRQVKANGRASAEEDADGPRQAGEQGQATEGLALTPRFGVSGSLGVLDYRQNARSDEACRAHHAAAAVQLADLDRRARAADLDAAPGTGGFDDVLPGSAVAGVDQDLDKISFGHYASISTQFGRYLNVAQPPAKAKTVGELSAAAAACQGCDLWQEATQTVFGEGKEGARMMLVGEQPGDQEDLQGRPFVGPAGRVLEQALDEAGIDRRRVYVTNAVKHFRFTRRGKRRLHEKPNAAQVRACRPWLEAEIEVVKPGLIVLLGATAAQSVMGPAFRVSKQHGQVLESPFGIPVVATVHPSSILRSIDDKSRDAAMSSFIADLMVAARHG